MVIRRERRTSLPANRGCSDTSSTGVSATIPDAGMLTMAAPSGTDSILAAHSHVAVAGYLSHRLCDGGR